MQLESTLFGIVAVQVTPALERLLKLDSGSLTKEIQLSQVLQYKGEVKENENEEDL